MGLRGPLVDTSVLIDYFGGTDNRETRILDHLLEQGPPPATAPIIVQEYLQGLVIPGEFSLARAGLENFDQLPPPDYHIHLRAARLHLRMNRCFQLDGGIEALRRMRVADFRLRSRFGFFNAPLFRV